jgi:putative endonuclease
MLVFIEVRSRTSTNFGLPQETISHHKQQRLRRIAQFYLLGRTETAVRFDVVAVFFDREGNLRRLEHIPNAF